MTSNEGKFSKPLLSPAQEVNVLIKSLGGAYRHPKTLLGTGPAALVHDAIELHKAALADLRKSKVAARRTGRWDTLPREPKESNFLLS
jgi:hypothetical protein